MAIVNSQPGVGKPRLGTVPGTFFCFPHGEKAFLAALHDVGSWSLWKGKNFTFHQMFVDHANAEYPERVYVEKTDRTVDEWRKRPGGPDNHLGDCLVMCLVAQAMLGLGLWPAKVSRKPRKKRRRIKPSYKV